MEAGLTVPRSQRPRRRALNTIPTELGGMPRARTSTAALRHIRVALGNAAQILFGHGPLRPFVGLFVMSEEHFYYTQKTSKRNI